MATPLPPPHPLLTKEGGKAGHFLVAVFCLLTATDSFAGAAKADLRGVQAVRDWLLGAKARLDAAA